MSMVNNDNRGETTTPAIRNVGWRTYRLPFRERFSTSREAATYRFGAIVEVSLETGVKGLGEVAPLPLSHPAALAAALEPAPALLAELTGQSLDEALGNLERYVESRSLPVSLICGVETALLDALARQLGRRLSTLLASFKGPVKTAVPVNALIGEISLSDSVDQAVEAAAAGFSCIKLKVGGRRRPEQDIELVRAVRQAIGPDIALRLDANGAWSFPEATAVLSGCRAYDPQYVEEPLASALLHELPALRDRTGVPIALDEALADLSDVQSILEGRYADVLVIKPQVVGGLRMSQKIIEAASRRGIECVLTSSIESGIGVAAILQLAAAMPEVRLASGLATLPLLADDLILEQLPVRAGAISTPAANGLGVWVDETALARYGE